MKTIVKLIVLGCGLMMWAALPAFSDEPGPPPPPGEHGVGGNQGPAGAPIDGGLGILLGIGAIYGGKKYLQAKKTKKRKTAAPETTQTESGFTNNNVA
ncbi:MAG: hypothetical protein NTY96_12445 [Bacteroidetes bacterium]|nr:hypothetical protein [Bacteroidota bacterium]